jgi:hypothetical protein
MSDPRSSFPERFGYRASDAEITVREDAPEEIRAGVVILGYATGMGPGSMRDAVCEVLLKRPKQLVAREHRK